MAPRPAIGMAASYRIEATLLGHSALRGGNGSSCPIASLPDVRPRGDRAPPLLRPRTKCRALLGGGCHGSRCCQRSMGAKKGADMAHRQRNLVWGVLPRIKAHLRIRREMHRLHRHGVRVAPVRRPATPRSARPIDLKRTGGLATLGVAQIGRDNAKLPLEFVEMG
jgi:hypothetical protein